jgi:hypothetical protein
MFTISSSFYKKKIIKLYEKYYSFHSIPPGTPQKKEGTSTS